MGSSVVRRDITAQEENVSREDVCHSHNMARRCTLPAPLKSGPEPPQNKPKKEESGSLERTCPVWYLLLSYFSIKATQTQILHVEIQH
mmetsp:Transcript_16157/g.25987  ORF Transcript_16157/g.25987 Transcript_16157/m.25987 type:complete len:88 (-) Transcript_16157:52-315(-)